MSQLSDDDASQVDIYESLTDDPFALHLAPNHNMLQYVVAQDDEYSLSSRSDDSEYDGYLTEEENYDVHTAEEDLMILIRKNNISPEMYGSIMSWAKGYCSSGYNFHSPHYKTVMSRLLDRYGENAGGLALHSSFTIENFPPTHIYRNQFMKHALIKYGDSNLMEGGLYRYNGESDVFSELNTGNWWKNAEINIAERMGIKSGILPKNHYIAPVILFDDSTLLDNLGRLTAHPILVSFGNICGVKRRSHTAWFLLGLIPPYPKTSEERERDSNKKATRHNYNLYYHNCLRVLLQDFALEAEKIDGTNVHVCGMGEVFLHFELCFIIGDTVGQDPMCGKLGGYSVDTPRLVRDCNVSTEKGDVPSYKCKFNDVAEIRDFVRMAISDRDNNLISSTAANDRVKEISQLLFESVYWNFSFGGNVHGVHGSLPIEILHAFLLGPMKILLESIFEHTEVPEDMREWFVKRINNRPDGSTQSKPPYTGTKSKPSRFRKEEFERRFRSVTRAAFRQSDREMPRCPFKHGVTSLTRLCGQEYPGLCLLTMVCMEGVIKDDHDRACTLERKYCYLLWMSLSLEVLLTKEEYSKEDDPRVIQRNILYFMRCYREVVGEQREVHSKTGLRTTKFHSMKHFMFYIEQFGSPHNFSGLYLEAALKPFLKEQTKRTTRQHNRYLLDLMNRVYEMMVMWHLDKLKKRLKKEKEETNVCDENDGDAPPWRFKSPKVPAFTLEFSTERKKWETKTKENQNSERLYHPKQDDDLGLSWVTEMCNLANRLKCKKVSCYYSIKVPGPKTDGPPDTFRCDPDYRSYPWNKWGWFDWAIVKFPGFREPTAARIRMWGMMQNEDDTDIGMYAIVNPLELSQTTNKHHIFTWMSANKISSELRAIYFDQIKSVAYVLPASQPLPKECREGKNREAEKAAYPDDVRDHRYYIVLPPRSKWGESGWKEIKSSWKPAGR